MPEHTPGPWSVEMPDEHGPFGSAAFNEGPMILGPEGQLIAEVLSADLSDDPAEMFATNDSRLIAAGPKMLKVLRTLECLNSVRADEPVIRMVRAVIAEATEVPNV